MIGDRILTDIIGGNKTGIFTIKVQPLQGDPVYIKIIRFYERLLMAQKRNLNK
jgi:predicted HAD superfamily phosphohydrolase YqeG